MTSAISSRVEGQELARRLSFGDSIAIVAGIMIGGGIFLVPNLVARSLPSAAWIVGAWIFTGVLSFFGALAYAELGAMIPSTGGQYVFLRESYGPMVGFLNGWTLFAVIQTGTIAAVGVAFAKFLGVLVPDLGTKAYLWVSPALGIEFKLRLPWMDEPEVFYKLDRFRISAGQFVGVGMIALLTAVNCFGVREGKWVQNFFTVAKILGLGLLIVLGLTVAWNTVAVKENRTVFWESMRTERFVSIQNFAHFGWLAALMVAGGAMVGSLFAADAWGNVTFVAAEVKNARRTLPLSLALGTTLVIVLYLLANGAYLADLPLRTDAQVQSELKAAKGSDEEREDVVKRYRDEPEKLGIENASEDRVGTAALQRISPSFGVPLMAFAIMLSTFGCLNGLVLMGARLYYAMAKDGLFFQPAARLNSHGVPAAGLILQAVWASVLVFSGTYNELLDYVIFAALMFYVLIVGGVFVLRHSRPQAERPYRVIGYPLVPALYMCICTLIMLDLLVVKPAYSWPSFAIMATGVPVYWLWRRRGVNR